MAALRRAKQFVAGGLRYALFRNQPSKEKLLLLRDEFRTRLEAEPLTVASPSWLRFMHELKVAAKSNDIACFLQWPTVQKIMVVGDAPYIAAEFRRLRTAPDWQTRWRYALREDAFGSPNPSRHYLRSSANLIHGVHHIAAFEAASRSTLSYYDVIVEFGGGYGSQSRACRRLGFVGTYVIHDLPPFSALQSLYLQAIGVPTETLVPTSTAAHTFLCDDSATAAQWMDRNLTGKRALFIATWSLSEAPIAARKPFADRLKKFAAMLIAYQSEDQGIDNTKYMAELKHALPGWHFTDEAIPGMAESTGRYLFGYDGVT